MQSNSRLAQHYEVLHQYMLLVEVYIQVCCSTIVVAISLPVGQVWSGPVWSGPVWSGPVWSGPVWSGPVWSGPVWSGPVWSGPVWSGPVWSGPVWSGPVWSGPVWSGPVWSAPQPIMYHTPLEGTVSTSQYCQLLGIHWHLFNYKPHLGF